MVKCQGENHREYFSDHSASDRSLSWHTFHFRFVFLNTCNSCVLRFMDSNFQCIVNNEHWIFNIFAYHSLSYFIRIEKEKNTGFFILSLHFHQVFSKKCMSIQEVMVILKKKKYCTTKHTLKVYCFLIKKKSPFQ